MSHVTHSATVAVALSGGQPAAAQLQQFRRVAAPDSLKNENICRDPKSLINLAIEHPTATPPTTVHALAVWDVWGDPNVLMV